MYAIQIRVLDLFKEFDKDMDGYLSVSELQVRCIQIVEIITIIIAFLVIIVVVLAKMSRT